MNYTSISPLTPFDNMSRRGDFIEMVVNSFSDAFGFGIKAKALFSLAVHHAYKNNDNPVLSDIIDELNLLDIRSEDEELRCDIGLLFPFANDNSYPEYNLFSDRDGYALNQINLDGIKLILMNVSNHNIKVFFEKMILFSLMF